MYLASRDLKKTLSDHFSRLRVPPRDPPVWRPYSSRSTPGPQKGPRGLPGTPQEPLRAPPGPPRAPLKILSWHIFFLKSWVFSFYTFFPLILTFLQSVSLFVNVPLSAFTYSLYSQTPPGTPPGPSRDPPRTLSDPPRTLSDQGRRSGSIQLVQTRQVLTMFARSSGSIQRSDSSMDYKHRTKHKQSSWQRSGPAECAERLN